MLYTENLEEIVFHRHEMFASDELIVLSGYVGPKPVERLQFLPFPSKVIYGMYGVEGIKRPLHNSFLNLQNSIDRISIFYSNDSVCLLSLFGRDGEVQNAAGLNWGQNPTNHTTKNDSYIKIRIQDIKNYPELFPPKQVNPLRFDGRGRTHRHNDNIEIIWDDEICMEGLFFGNQTVNGVMYPKQVSSFPHASEMGKYLRRRLNVPEGQPIRKFHLDRYGRNTIGISLVSEGVYRFDFSL